MVVVVMADRVIVNASPLIVLFKGGLADILPRLFGEVLVPDAAWREVIAGSIADAAARQLTQSSWARRTITTITDPVITAWNLGAGEAEVSSLAFTHSGSRAMVDDTAARACARTLGIKTLGTGGALVLAKRAGIITSVGSSLQSLRDAGIWLSDEVVRLLEQQAGE